MTRIKISIVIKVVALVFYFLLAFFLAKAQAISNFSSGVHGLAGNTSSGSIQLPFTARTKSNGL
jgi:hypothetical protein